MTTEEAKARLRQIDDELARLFIERTELDITDAAAERETVSRLTEGQTDAMAGYIKTLFATVFDLTRSEQARRRRAPSKVAADIDAALAGTPKLFPKSAAVACQGVEGANSTAACEKMFERPSIMYFKTFEGVFNAVSKDMCRYGVLPVENSLHGSVADVYGLMKKYDCFIVRSIKLKINHVLLAAPGVELKDVKKIYSHEQALGQCGEFLKGLNAEIEACENTAAAARMISEGDMRDAAAISSLQCAELYNLNVLCENIQNSDNNYTRFVCLSKKLEIYPGASRLSLMMTLPHKPGSLYRLMAKFAALGINLTKLESRPLPDKDFEFLFYFDLDVSVYDEAVIDLFSQLEGGNEKFMFLGCY